MRLATSAELAVEDTQYLGQYQNQFMFNAALFLAGTAFDKLVTRIDAPQFVGGCILVTLRRPPLARRVALAS